MRMLSMAKGASTTFGRIIGGLPRRIMQEHAQMGEVVRIQMLLLLAERCQLSSGSILVPGVIALLGFSGRTPLASFILPDGNPRLQEAAGDAERVSDRGREQIR